MGDAGSTTLLVLGFVLGVRHALDADHLTAVLALVSEERQFKRTWRLGVTWGLGHTTSLLIMAALVLATGVRVPRDVATWLELAVALMLMLLGGRLLWQLVTGRTAHHHAHEHGRQIHAHPHLHESGRDHERNSSRHHFRTARSYVVGLIHGLAGSAALLLVAVAESSNALNAIGYVIVFGIGSIGGMLMMSIVISVPFAATLSRLPRLNFGVRAAAGTASLGVGLVLGYQFTLAVSLF